MYIYQAYPKCKYTWNGETTTVQNAEEEAALGAGWVDNPDPFKLYSGQRPPRAPDQEPTKWVNEWPIPELSAGHRNRIKAALLRADAEFWANPDNPLAEKTAMRTAFTGIANVLSEAGALTEGRLRNEIPLLVWDSAIAGGWYRFASEKTQPIFPTQRGNYWVWLDKSQNWDDIFYSQIAFWRAWLLDATEEDGPITPEEANNLPTDFKSLTDVAPPKEKPPQLQARQWNDLTITFISDERVNVAHR